MAHYAYAFALLASTLWFAAACRYFSFQHRTAAKVLIPRSARDSPLFETTAALSRFLGGMNGALAIFSATLLGIWMVGSPAFDSQIERGVILIALAAAHFSQFIFNVPTCAMVSGKGKRTGTS